MQARGKGLLEIHLAVILFGMAGLFGKLLTTSSVWIAWGRVWFAAVVLGGVLLVRHQAVALDSRRDSAMMFASGGLLAAHWTTFFQAIKVSSVAVGLLAFATFPVFVAFLEPLCFRERLRAADFKAAMAAVAGVAVVVPGFTQEAPILAGMLWGLLSGLLFAFLVVFNRALARRHSSLKIAFWQDSVACGLLLPLVPAFPPVPGVRDWVWLAVLGIFCTALAHSLFIRGMRKVDARLASIIASLEPVYGIMAAALLIGERPGWRILAGGALIVGAALYAAWHQRPNASCERQSLIPRP